MASKRRYVAEFYNSGRFWGVRDRQTDDVEIHKSKQDAKAAAKEKNNGTKRVREDGKRQTKEPL